LNAVRLLPPVPVPPKILCVGLNYDDHLEESGLKKPVYPEIFGRFATSLIAHQQPIRRPRESTSLDYEAELAVVIGRAGRRIPRDQALDHVAGYSVFNDATIRDFRPGRVRIGVAGS
jgi:2-keto-4-pentenoate hydratase/2-oxohepta-3-ene-1,7-dioic acid hydratase in catechol pathway